MNFNEFLLNFNEFQGHMVDLLSKKEESAFKRIPLQESGTALFYISLALFFLALASYGGLFVLNRGQQETARVLNDEIRVKEENLNPAIINEIFSLDKRISQMRTLISGHIFTSNLLRLLEERTHPKVQFTSFNFNRESRKVDMAGTAASYAVLAEQIGLLERHPQIERVEFGGLAQTAQGSVGFKTTLLVKESLLQLQP